MTQRRFRVLSEEDTDPMLSSVNLVDVFMVAVVMMAISLLSHPANALKDADYTIIRNPGQANMEITVKQGKRLTRFQATGSSTEGNGVKAGIAYEMNDGSMVYVPTSRSKETPGEKSGEQ